MHNNIQYSRQPETCESTSYCPSMENSLESISRSVSNSYSRILCAFNPYTSPSDRLRFACKYFTAEVLEEHVNSHLYPTPALNSQLRTCVNSGQTVAARIIFNAGADPHALPRGLQQESAFSLAMKIREDTLKALFVRHPDFVEKIQNGNYESIEEAARQFKSEEVIYILEELQPDNIPSTLLSYMASSCNARAVEVLLELGADINALGKDGSTALQAACRRPVGMRHPYSQERNFIIDLLRRYGAEQNVVGSRGLNISNEDIQASAQRLKLLIGKKSARN